MRGYGAKGGEPCCWVGEESEGQSCNNGPCQAGPEKEEDSPAGEGRCLEPIVVAGEPVFGSVKTPAVLADVELGQEAASPCGVIGLAEERGDGVAERSQGSEGCFEEHCGGRDDGDEIKEGD